MIQAKLVAKENGIWAADGLTRAAERLCDLKIQSTVSDGKAFHKGDTLQIWTGKTIDVLKAERPFLNVAAYASGIATRTSEAVTEVKKANVKPVPRVTCTRKILPGFRDLALYALQAGGGYPHRVGLSGGVLIKENHVKAAGNIKNAITLSREVAPHGLRIEVEVRNLEELRETVELKAECVMLDNFSPKEVAAALREIASAKQKVIVEVSGGINQENIREYVQEGVDVISMGSLTHSVKSVDLSLLVI